MRLLIVTFDSPENIGGIEGRVKGIVEELKDSGDLTVIEALVSGSHFSRGKLFGVPFYKCPSSSWKVPEVWRFTLRLIGFHSVDAVLMLSGGITLFGVLLLAECRLLNVPSAALFYGRDILQARSRPLGLILLRASQALAKRPLTNSMYTRSLLPRSLQPRTGLYYPSVDPKLASDFPELKMPDDRPTLLFVGRLVERKGVDILIRATKALSENIPSIRLDIVGDGPDKIRLMKLATYLGVSDIVTFHGTLTGAPLWDMYRKCWVFVMPSLTLAGDAEGFGTVFLEAGLFGKPSVGTLSGGIPEAIVDHVTGILVDESDPRGLAETLGELIVDETLRTRLGQNAKGRVQKEFTWPVSALKLRQLLGRNPKIL